MFNQHTDFVVPNSTRTKGKYPYSYSTYFIWKDGKRDGDEMAYSDRLREQYGDMARVCWESCTDATRGKGIHQMHTLKKEEVSLMLSLLFKKKIEATALAEGCNASNGYPYWMFWFKEIK